MNRREFIGKSALIAAACCYGAEKVSADTLFVQAKNKNKIGIQLYSIRNELPKDPQGCLKKLADIGYAHAEAYGYDSKTFLGKRLKEWAVMMQDVGMKLTSTHCGTGLLPADVNTKEWDYWRNSATEMKEADGLFLAQSFLPSDKSLDEIKRVAEQFNKIGLICKSAGVRFGYHNHYTEFKTVDGEVVMDTLVKNTDPKLVFFQMDLGHVLKGGADILAYINKYPGRFIAWHASDFKIGGAYTEVGQGSVPYPELLKNADRHGVIDLTVEQETGGDIFASCKNDFNYLAQFQWTKAKKYVK
ncbi:MAG: sugar phosphate isomerase/epimerase [Tannerella sp.]|jgi:sugar phosphate isomerase/epimerase|nr:sugar phosphate isomerase/epimerase [Tannerella sp.]